MFRSLRATKLPQEHVFSVAVGASSKITLASWHLLEPADVVSVAPRSPILPVHGSGTYPWMGYPIQWGLDPWTGCTRFISIVSKPLLYAYSNTNRTSHKGDR